MLLDFYKNKRVLITGHTGFKGAWLCKMLADAGAIVSGYALEPPTEPSLFALAGIGSLVHSHIGDIRDFDSLLAVFKAEQPEIVFHLAAQPIVRESYKNPRYTYETNVMGTVNVCECVRLCGSVKSFLNITTDKVYENTDLDTPFTENMKLDGFDPYSNSKSCSELVTHSYIKSFFNDAKIAVSTARAGNVIGGGDFAADRLIPDCVRAAQAKTDIIIRNPYSTRPFQHVLEPLKIYLTIAAEQYADRSKCGFYNVGPDECDCRTTGELADIFCKYWGEGLKWVNVCEQNAPHEAAFLRLDTALIKKTFGYAPVWSVEKAVEATVDFTKAWLAGEDVQAVMQAQIKEFLK